MLNNDSKDIPEPPKLSVYPMDEFWKGITLSPSHHPISAAAAAVSTPGGDVSHSTILQEFLALPTDGGQAPHGTVVSTASAHQNGHPPATALSLNTRRLPFLPPDPITPPALPPTPHLFNTRKRQPETDGDDRRHHERLIKNRESAARSRARKRAYTYQLEMKIAHLKRENDKLRRQKEKVRMEMEVSAMPSKKKNKLCRTLTAPF